MATLDKAALFAIANKDIPPHPVEVEGYGTVYVRVMTAREKDSFDASNSVLKGDSLVPRLDNYRGRFAARVICNEKGVRIFEDDDAGQLGDMPAPVLDAILSKAREVNGMTAAAFEEARKN